MDHDATNIGITAALRQAVRAMLAGAMALAPSLALAPALAGCADDAPPRDQWVLLLDTDAPLVGDLRANPALSADAAVDTLRIDVFSGDRVIESRVFSVPSGDVFPLSLGIVPPVGGVLVRARLFRSAFAASGVGADGTPTTDPYPDTTIDRLIGLGPATGVPIAKVTLSVDCLGTPALVGGARRTCVDGARPWVEPADGIELGTTGPHQRFATVSPIAKDVPCVGEAPPGALCIPGGFSVLGDDQFEGLSEGSLVPLRPVRLSPFFIDEIEFTVGRFRALVAAGALKGELPRERKSGDVFLADCTWRGPLTNSADALPLNCVPVATAEAACAAAGGMLPSEAEWEHAARGRGERRRFPWGEATPACCTASVSRENPVTPAVVCKGRGPEPAGSHRRADGCPGGGDLSRDGVLDLGGSLAEVTRDRFRPYGSDCLGKVGLLTDPVCADTTLRLRVLRGGDWSSGPLRALSALRKSTDVSGDNLTGFRCRYPVTP